MLRVLTAAALAAGVAAAAPVPKAPPVPSPKSQAAFSLGTAAVVDQKGGGPVLKFSYELPPLASAVDPAIGGRPRPPRVSTVQYTLEGVKVTTADGKELTGDDLTKKLSEPVAAVQSATAFDAEWRKLFADDVLFVELVRPAGGGFNPNPGGGVVRPLPAPIIRPGVIRPALPPIQVEEPPVEKKEEKPAEKKEEKK